MNKVAAIGLIALLISACESYDFTVNDRVVYTPKPLFAEFEVTDEALGQCLEQAIADVNATAAYELKVLNCSHAGISDLQGLSTFTGLTHLKLSGNAIANISEIERLSSLEELYLDENAVLDPVPEYELLSLRALDLGGNPDLQCPPGGAFIRLTSVVLPEHCKQ